MIWFKLLKILLLDLLIPTFLRADWYVVPWTTSGQKDAWKKINSFAYFLYRSKCNTERKQKMDDKNQEQ